VYPDFIGIGAQKAGTTWLGRNLQAHPELWMPRLKEVHYFDEKIHEPKNAPLRLARRVFGGGAANRRWRSQVGRRTKKHLEKFSGEDFWWDLKYYAGAPNDGWYASLFEPGRGRMVGEITPAYSTLDRDVVARVHGLMADAKIILMMRNPMERVWSQTVMSFDRGKDRSIDAATEEELLRHFGGEGARRRTDYLRTLETWGAFYPPERIFVGFLEDVHFFPEELLRAVYGFLGVDPSFEPPRADSKVHTRSTGSAPARPMAHLARSYLAENAALERRFGGYASFWRFCAERLSEEPPDGSVVYPLWGSPLWEEWGGPRKARPQSGPLPSLPPAGEGG
jgi:hypothetical protein